MEMELSVDEKGRKVCTFEDEKVVVHIVLKKDYSEVEPKLRNAHITKDIKTALKAVSETEEFKDLVDSYGLLYIEKQDAD